MVIAAAAIISAAAVPAAASAAAAAPAAAASAAVAAAAAIAEAASVASTDSAPHVMQPTLASDADAAVVSTPVPAARPLSVTSHYPRHPGLATTAQLTFRY